MSIGGRTLILRLHGKPAEGARASIEAAYQIGHKQPKNQSPTLSREEGERVVSLRFDDAEAKEITEGAPLAVAVSRDRVYLYDTQGIAPLLTASDECNRKTFLASGATPEMVAAMATEPFDATRTFFSSDDYPASAVVRHQEGKARVLLATDKNGRVITCQVVSSSEIDALDDASCNILKRRGKYEPGLNKAGKPIPAPVLVTIKWVLPIER